MKRAINIAYLLVSLISFSLQVYGQNDSLPVACGGSRVRYSVADSSGLAAIFDWQIVSGYSKDTIIANNNNLIDIQWGPSEGIRLIKVTEHTSFGCYAPSKFAKVFVSSPQLSIKQNFEVCQGQTVNFDPQISFSSYLWSSGSTNRSVTMGTTGWYKLIATNMFGCNATDSVFLQVDALPYLNLLQTSAKVTPNSTSLVVDSAKKGIEICNTTYTLDAGSEGVKYNWSNGAITQTVLVGDGKQELWVTVENDKGCVNTDTINILPCRGVKTNVSASNAFTPNGDGDNDYWKPKGVDSKTLIEIYDRWGRVVGRWNGNFPEEGWNGNSRNGKPLPMDSYYYVIKPGDGSSPKAGTVTIIR